MGVIENLKKARESSKKFDEVRGDNRPEWLKVAGDYIPGYSHYQSAKFVKDCIEHPKEGVQVIKDVAVAAKDLIGIADKS